MLYRSIATIVSFSAVVLVANSAHAYIACMGIPTEFAITKVEIHGFDTVGCQGPDVLHMRFEAGKCSDNASGSWVPLEREVWVVVDDIDEDSAKKRMWLTLMTGAKLTKQPLKVSASELGTVPDGGDGKYVVAPYLVMLP